jgi:hypothetical protein
MMRNPRRHMLAQPSRWASLLLTIALLSLGACGDDGPSDTPPPAGDLRRQTVDVLNSLTSVAFNVTHPNEPTDMGNGLTLTSVEGEAAFPDRSNMTAKGAFGRVNVTFGIIQIGDATYMRDPISQRWNSIDPSTLPFDFNGMNQSVANALKGATEVAATAGESIGGAQTYLLTGKITSDDLRGLVPGAAPGLPLDLEAWVRRSDGMPLRVVLHGRVIAEDAGTMVRQLDLGSFNDPVTVEPPI